MLFSVTCYSQLFLVNCKGPIQLRRFQKHYCSSQHYLHNYVERFELQDRRLSKYQKLKFYCTNNLGKNSRFGWEKRRVMQSAISVVRHDGSINYSDAFDKNAKNQGKYREMDQQRCLDPFFGLKLNRNYCFTLQLLTSVFTNWAACFQLW